MTLALVANWFALRERGKATSYWWIGTMIGPMLTGVIITTLIVTVGWRWQFHAMGILALILPLPMVWFLMRDKPEQHPAVNAAEVALIRGRLESRTTTMRRRPHPQDASATSGPIIASGW